MPVFTLIKEFNPNDGGWQHRSLCFTELTRTSDGASVAMDIESLDEDELRRSVGRLVGWSVGRSVGWLIG